MSSSARYASYLSAIHRAHLLHRAGELHREDRGPVLLCADEREETTCALCVVPSFQLWLQLYQLWAADIEPRALKW